MLKFYGEWRFKPPADGQYRNQTIPQEAVEDFYRLITKTASQGDRQEILEHFKGAFCASIGSMHVWSSNEGWSETDLQNVMSQAAENAPSFIEAFFDACKSLSQVNQDYYAPGAEMINEVCDEHRIGYRVRPPKLVLLEAEISVESNSAEQNKKSDSDASDKAFASTSDLLTNTSETFIQIDKSASIAAPLRRLQVFLCHSSGDKPAIRELYRRLKTDGIDPWLDEENLLPGQEWQQEIPKAVRNNGSDSF